MSMDQMYRPNKQLRSPKKGRWEEKTHEDIDKKAEQACRPYIES